MWDTNGNFPSNELLNNKLKTWLEFSVSKATGKVNGGTYKGIRGHG